MKTCTKCGNPQEENQFGKLTKAKDGLRSWCKTCQREDSKKREASYNAYRRQYRLEHQEESKAKKKDYFLRNKEKVLGNNAAWRQTLNGRLLSYKRNAKLRGFSWKLTNEEFQNFWNKPCYYCNTVITGVGIDRVDPKEGYTSINTVPCCTQCNTMKMDYSKQEFLDKIQQIWNKHKPG